MIACEPAAIRPLSRYRGTAAFLAGKRDGNVFRGDPHHQGTSMGRAFILRVRGLAIQAARPTRRTCLVATRLSVLDKPGIDFYRDLPGGILNGFDSFITRSTLAYQPCGACSFPWR